MSKQIPLNMEVEERKVMRLREVPFTVVERAELGDQAAKHDEETRIAKAQAKESEKARDEILKKRTKGTKSVDVECRAVFSYINRSVQVFDGDELIEERAMNEDEFQLEFPTHHGVVMDKDPDEANNNCEATPEKFNEDMDETMRAERSRHKPSLVDMNT